MARQERKVKAAAETEAGYMAKRRRLGVGNEWRKRRVDRDGLEVLCAAKEGMVVETGTSGAQIGDRLVPAGGFAKVAATEHVGAVDESESVVVARDEKL